VRSAVEKSASLPRPSPSRNASALPSLSPIQTPCHAELLGSQHFVSQEAEGPAVALAVAHPRQPSPGAPSIAHLARPHKNPTSLSAIAFLVVARRRRMGLCLSALEWRFPAPSRAAATALPKAEAKPEGLEETDLWPLHFFFVIFRPKIACQAPKSSKPAPQTTKHKQTKSLTRQKKIRQTWNLVSLNPLK
jgi:hypothetical protein